MAAVDWPLSAMHKSPEGELLIETSREGPYSSLRGLRVEWGETDTEVCKYMYSVLVLDREWRSRTASRWRGERGAGP